MTLTVESLLIDQVKELKELLALEQSRVIQFERDRESWDAERRYLVDTVMLLTGATKGNPLPQGEEAEVIETRTQASGRKPSWPQALQMMEQRKKIMVMRHKQALASAAQGVQNASQ